MTLDFAELDHADLIAAIGELGSARAALVRVCDC
jgi:hypothetical protein